MTAILERLSNWNWIPYLFLAGLMAWTMYDAFVPVVWTRGELVEKADSSVTIRMSGYKLRACRYVGIQAYSIGKSDMRQDAFIRRIDLESRGTTRPRGRYDLGLWEIRPTTGATGVVVYAQHACTPTDLRATKMAEVKL
jgi:hypothetical protein